MSFDHISRLAAREIPTMTIARACLLFLIVAATVHPASADDNVNVLPRDGAWVRYHTAVKSDDGKINYAGEQTFAVVGRRIENVGACRWVELKIVSNETGVKATSIFKLLIPEKALLEEKDPVQHVVRAWVKYDDQPASELTPAALNAGDPETHIALGSEMLFWPGVLRKAKRVAEEKTVRFKKSRLVMPEGYAGKFVAEIPSLKSEAKRIDTTDFEMWFHRDLPMGFAFARTRLVSSGGDGPEFLNMTTEYSVEDAGRDAKTLLPDNE
jgi:hypothetical protein